MFYRRKNIGYFLTRICFFSAVLIGAGIMVLIIKTIRFIKTHKNNKKKKIVLNILLKNKIQNKEVI